MIDFNIGDSVIVHRGVAPSMLRGARPHFNELMDKTVGMRGVVCEIDYDKVRVCFDCIKDLWWYRKEWLIPAIEFNEEFDMDDVIL